MKGLRVSAETPTYDVAISFLYQDAELAKSLYDRLSEGLDVFFFPRSQEELAGTDGLESMREMFRHESRLNVVLYRPRWGNTPWTSVEAAAIKDSCLATGYRSIFFFVIEPTQDLPTWLPESHVYFNYANYTVEQAVGAIKARVEERGGHYKPLTPARKAELLRVEEDFRRDLGQLSSADGIAKILDKVKELFEQIRRECEEVNSGGHFSIHCSIEFEPGIVQQVCMLGEHRVGMSIVWFQRYGNSLDGSALIVREFNQNLIIPPGHMYLHQPKVIREAQYAPDLSRAREYGWQMKHHKDAAFISAKDLASKCVNQFLDLVERDRTGKVKREGWV
jgi:hypothetical protein